MQHIANSKIGQYIKPKCDSPMVRLPRECSKLIGQRVQIYKTQYEGILALLSQSLV